MSNGQGRTDTIPAPDESKGLVLHSGMLARWIEADPELAVKRIESMNRILETLRAAAIKATHPSDWVIHVSRDRDGNVLSQRGYLQDIGVERAAKLWGIEVSAPIIERVPAAGTHEDGTFEYHMLADAWSKVTGERAENVTGSRWSGDKFFRKSEGPDDKVDPTDVLKAAYANLHGRAGRALMGLNGVPLDVLKAAGLDVAKVVMVDYEKGGKGGESTGAAVGTADVVMAFGKGKGLTPAELADKDLAWYIGAAEKSLADPSKANFHKAEQRRLAALKAELERRAQKAAHEEATGTEEPAAAANGNNGHGSGRIGQAQVTEFWTLANRNGWAKPQTAQLLDEVGVTMVDQIPMAAWETVKAALSKAPAGAAS